MMLNDVIFDVDGTLLDIQHRVHLIRPPNGGKKEWRAFRAQAVNDSIIAPIAMLARMLYNRHDVRIIISTGRMEDERPVTTEMLAAHGVNYNRMYMRKQDDFRADSDIKREMLAQMRGDGFNPVLVFDDRQQVVDMWRAEGLTCCQVAPGQF
jgi:phosphoglycolate phosphatase-like HAD superfamily hydrolase